MSEPRSKSPQGGENGQDSGAQDDKPRLTEEEKKQNHIASEQKRREAIRAGFDRLCDLVPGLEGHGRSEGFVLKETVKYMREQLARRRELVEEAETRGATVPDHLKEPVKILERMEARQRDLHERFGGKSSDGEGS
ncbi:uncharacterized protein GGS22DRAFT_170590 [Annulohypoxylon maeteangense]|uniref:uncharacterized protein n=1 Tax=Annulohypoxylon maeteangense TaxID=1927788 RepID=UPI00200780B5|nr:uncharacterized protein GGS22DRAFT_170590 [Annulohypoxylon maeteangense]KAI0882277.1 hypothetical protein GGS22DRAFT_170590 [Annulohypoxylon maeteangense]